MTQRRELTQPLTRLPPGVWEGHAYQEARDQIRTALRHHGAPEAALDDLEQDVFMAIMRLSAWPTRAQLSTWIWAVCRNLVVNHRERERVRSSLTSNDAAVLLAFVPGPDDKLTSANAEALIYRVLWRLPPTSRHVIFLREIRGDGYTEIAAALRITEQAAHAAHYRGMVALGRYAAEEDPELSAPAAKPAPQRET